MRRIAVVLAILGSLLCSGVAALGFELPDATVLVNEANVRRTASATGASFWKLRRGDRVKVKAINGEFYKVRLSGEKEGYVYYQQLDVKVWARVDNSYAWVHNLPDGASQVVGDLRGLDWIQVVNRWQTWYQVKMNNGNTGWVSQQFVEPPGEFFAAWLSFQQTTPVASGNIKPSQPQQYYSRNFTYSNNSNVPAGSLRAQIVEYAKQFQGVPYVYGGVSPRGFDCSGFVQYVFRNFNVKLERVSGDQAKMGAYVPKDMLMPGDLVFFGPGSVNHAGIYIGSGQFIHASSSGSNGHRVAISSLGEEYYTRHFVTARRVLAD
jgi:cell wall-associated NlpC family hydrolase